MNESRLLAVLTLLSAIGGFLFGYDTGVVSGALILLADDFNLSIVWQELIVSGTVGTALLFSLIGGYANDALGRKPVTLFSSFVFTLGALVLAAAADRYMLLVGRIIIGMGLGLASMTAPMYIGEIAPAEVRGRMVTINVIMLTSGQFIASIVDGAFSYDQENGWRYMLGLAAVPAAIQFVGFIFMPESPRWLVQKRSEEAAAAVLKQIRSPETLDAALAELKQYREQQKTQPSDWEALKMMFSRSYTRRALAVGCLMQVFQQLAGINTVMYYSASIMQMSGIGSNQTVIWMAAVSASANCVFTFLGLLLIDKVGRRVLVLVSLLGACVGLALLGGSFALMTTDDPSVTLTEFNSTYCSQFATCDGCIHSGHCGMCFHRVGHGAALASCLAVDDHDSSCSLGGRCSNETEMEAQGLQWVSTYCPSRYSYLTLAAMMLYLAAFAPGMGIVPWVVNAEIYPIWGRSIGSGLSTTCNWATNLVVSFTFLSLIQAVSQVGAFLLYSGLALLAFLFVLLFLPETKGVPLEVVQETFSGKSIFMGLHPPPAARSYSRVIDETVLIGEDNDS